MLAQGDTTTVLATGLACFYRRIPFGHVEAGLRTGDLANPFPEEMNRTVASRLARFHFAPTAAARANLLREGIPDAAIHVTGNTVIDALLQVAERDVPIGPELDATKRLILVTAHRRESFGLPLREAFGALRTLADRNDDVQVLYPVHLNPNVSGPAREILGGHPRIVLCEPLEYAPFVSAMKRVVPDRHRLRRRAGGSARAGQARARPARRDRAPGGGGGGRGEAGGHLARRGSWPRRSACSTTRGRTRPWPAGSRRTATATPPSGSSPSCASRSSCPTAARGAREVVLRIPGAGRPLRGVALRETVLQRSF